jgi:hypothetical protein
MYSAGIREPAWFADAVLVASAVFGSVHRFYGQSAQRDKRIFGSLVRGAQKVPLFLLYRSAASEWPGLVESPFVNKRLFPIESPEQLARMRDVLREAGYHEKGLVGALGPIQLPARAGREMPYLLHLTRGPAPLNTLIRMFVLGVPVETDAAREALRPMELEDWTGAGLVETENSAARGRIRLLPYRDLLLACDHVDEVTPGGQLEMVMGITASSAALADFTVRRPCGTALDVGTGGGVQAFQAAAHSREVVGVDLCPRSVEFARLNAALNGIRNCEFIEGDSLEPVRDRTFDLIVSNPPFAITPSMRYMYRDSGMELDGFCRKLAAQASAQLNEGGLFQMCCDWAHMAGQDWKERLAGWFEGSGCDVWVLRTDTHSAADYAHTWIRDTERETAENGEQLFRDWLSYYEAKGLEAVSTGLIAMRRVSGRPNRVRIEESPDGVAGPFGDFVALGFEMHDYVAGASDAYLLDEKLRVAPLVRLDETCEWSEKGWKPASARIRLARGLTYASGIDLRLAGLLARCTGERTVRDLLCELAAATDSEAEKITPNILGLLRQLIERGFVLPVSLGKGL